MRVVITGASGNVGTALLRRLVPDDRVTSIVALARRRPSEDVGGSKVTWHEVDVARHDLMPHLTGADAVVHLAWLFQPTHRPMVTWEANAVGSARVFAAAGDAGVGAVVHASSVGAYSPAPGRTVDESWPTHSMPTAAYGREKAYAERALDAFEARHPGIRVVRLRPAFIFQLPAATEQRRIFAGPLLPNALVTPGRLPRVPLPPGLRFQALHADDVADAYARALLSEARGPFNVATDEVIDPDVIADVLDTEVLQVPRVLMRAGIALAWRAHLVPIDPALLDLVLGLPLLDSTRARIELGWAPRHTAIDAFRELIDGMSHGTGGPTPPLAPDSPSERVHELATGIGERP